MRNSMKKVTLALAMLPLLASAPVFATTGSVVGANGLMAGWASTAASQDRPIQLAQAGDQRVNQLQEQVRELSGKLEEMNFQVLQMQEQMRKIQEDNEFRFQELEKSKRSDAGGKAGRNVADARTGGQRAAGQTDEASQDASSAASRQNGEQNIGAASAANGSHVSSQEEKRQGELPQQLGSIRMDANGNVIGDTIDTTPRAVEQGASQAAGHGNEQEQGHGNAPTHAQSDDHIAALPQADDPNVLYQSAYQYVLSGDYKAAEAAFREHIKRYPADPHTADARYWLGESVFGQERYSEAATVFIDTQRDYPDSKRGPENMLKLGMTLQKMDNHDVACATFAQIPTRYPNAAPAVLKRVADERARSRC